MMVYRRIQELQRLIEDLQRDLDTAILGNNTRDMGSVSGRAHARAEDLQRELRAILNAGEIEKNERRFATAALDATMHAIEAAQKTGLAINADELRARLLVFKTWADRADAYIRAALGFEME